MSRVIDEKVVEMRFDNRDFEQNVSQSMSTIDKLKSALNFSGVESAFSGISSAADKVSFGGLSDAIDGVGSKFSALESIAVGALMNIGAKISDLAVETAKSLTIDQVTAGFDKYEKKTEAVQMIMNATGLEIEEVSDQLQRLNWYTDETSYDFAEMVNSIGKFTSAGIDLDTAITSMQGIANWAGVSGANKAEANRAMYNISQALAGGYMRLVDWKSIENANMATKEFKEMAIQAGLALGTLEEVDGKIGVVEGAMYNAEKGIYEGGDLVFESDWENGVDFKNFSQTLSKGKWFTNDVLTSVLDMYGKFTTELSAVYDELSETSDVTTSQIIKMTNQWLDNTLDMDQAMAMTGKSAEELEAIFSNLGQEQYALGRKAFAAAQEAKTFKDAIEATKDAVSTGWMNVFEQLFGNYEQAKVTWTELANELWDIFAGPISDINDTLTGWNNIKTPDGLNGRDLFIQSIKDIYHAVRSLVDPITEAWEAIFPPINSQGLFDLTARFQAFTERLELSEDTMARIGEAFEKIFGAIKFVTDGIKSLIGAFSDGLFGENAGGFGKGILIGIEEIADAIDGFIQKVKGISTVYDVFNETGRAAGKLEKLKEMYPVVYWLVDVFNKLKSSLGFIGEYIGKLFSLNNLFVYWGEAGGGIAGVINIITFSIRDLMQLVSDLVKTWTGVDLSEPFSKAWDMVLKFERAIEDLQADGVFERLGEKFFGLFDTFKERFGSITSWLEPLGDAMSSIWNDMVDGIGMLIGKEGEGVEGFFASIEKGLDAINEFIANSPTLGKVVEGFKGIIKDISEFLAKFLSLSDTIKTFREAGGGLSGVAAVITQKLRDILDLVADVIQRLTGLDLHTVGSAIATAFGIGLKAINKVISAVKTFFGLFKKDETKDLDEFGDKVEQKFSPLKSLFEGLKKFFEGIWNVLKQMSPIFATIGEKVGEAFGSIGDSLKNLDLNKVFEFLNKGLGIAFGAGIVRFIHSLSSPLEEIKGLLSPVKDVLDGVKGCFEAWQKDLQAKTLLKLAAAIGIVTVAVIALSQVDTGKLGSSIAAITLLFTDLIGAMTANNKLNGTANGNNMSKMGIAMIEMAASVLIMAKALTSIAEFSWEDILKGVTGLGIVMAEMVAVLNLMPKQKVKGGLVMIEMAAAILIAAQALKSIAEMSWEEMFRGLVGMGLALAEMVAALAILGNLGGSTFAKGTELILVAASLKIVASALKDFGAMQWEEIARGLVSMGGALTEITAVLVILGNFGQKMLSTSVSLVIVGAALKIIASALTSFSTLSWDEMARGLAAMAGALLEVVGVLVVLGMFANGALVNSAALVLVGAALNIISDALKSFAGLEWDEIARGLLAMGGALAEIVVTLLLLSAGGGIAGAAALIVVAGALALLAPVLHSFGEMSLAEIGKSLLELAGVFVVVGVAGLLLGPISPLILALGAAIALLGVGCVGVGAGLLMFSAGLTALAAAGTGAIDLLIYAITQILELIPLLITKVGEGILAVLKMMSDNAPAIAEMVVKLVAAILEAAQVLIPKLIETVVTIIDGILATLAEHSGSIIDSVATILLNILNGIAEYLPDFIQSGINIVLSLIEGLGQGIVDNAERAKAAFEELFKGIVEAILIFLGVDKDKAEEFVNIAGDMINGLTSGIAEFAMNAFLAIGEFMTNLVNKVREKLPEFIERGKEVIDNLKEGFNSKVEEAIEALKGVIDRIIEGAKGVVSKAKSIGQKVVDMIKGGTEEPEAQKAAETAGKTVSGSFASGMEKAATTTVPKAAKKVINSAIDSMKKEAAISSPSERTKAEVGEFLGEGVGVGIFDSIPNVTEKVNQFMDKVVDGMSDSELGDLAEEAGLNIGGLFTKGFSSWTEGSFDAGSLLAEVGIDGLTSQTDAAGDAGSLLAGTSINSFVSEYSSAYDAGTYDASGFVSGLESYSVGGDNAWYTEEVAYDTVTTYADGIVSNADLAENAGRTIAEATQDGFLGANWNEFQRAAAEPFQSALENLSGYASDPWFALSGSDFDQYNKQMQSAMNGSGATITPVVTYGNMQLQRDELEAYQISLDSSSSRAFGYLMNGFDSGTSTNYSLSEADQISALEEQLAYEKQARYAEESSNGSRWNEALTKMDTLNDNLAMYNDNITNMQVVMDTGALVGATAPSMDKEMGSRWEMSRRGV